VDIAYPTDLGLLNQARKQTEKIIDKLYKPLRVKLKKKPRTYRKIARRDYLLVAKKRRPTQKQRKKAIRKQLQYLNRNLAHIEQLINEGASLSWLNKKEYKKQQVEAFKQDTGYYPSSVHVDKIYRTKDNRAF
jgi:hypothetical protein